ncbi:nuclear transport factor 2 family protein [Actinophytocola sp.]|uniref:nuclear transport factor 2 family protein n=1 Tax=Actinophytocola sp. TaxID=1872138 RepID=UPI002D80647E|nr:nuclear transport factor 2 family protein [Actinophytocola sp.]HET9140926.1 nuclear transport factor 2 family protein [Actinophytocola sp.]
MSRTPREIAELTRKMVEGNAGIEFAELFAPDGVMEFPFFVPGFQSRLEGQDTIREFYKARADMRGMFDMHEVTQVVYETDDPEVVITEIEHHGVSRVTDAPYRMLALGVIRVRDGKIVHYRDFMNPLTLAELVGRMPDLIAAVSATGTGAAR